MARGKAIPARPPCSRHLPDPPLVCQPDCLLKLRRSLRDLSPEHPPTQNRNLEPSSWAKWGQKDCAHSRVWSTQDRPPSHIQRSVTHLFPQTRGSPPALSTGDLPCPVAPGQPPCSPLLQASTPCIGTPVATGGTKVMRAQRLALPTLPCVFSRRLLISCIRGDTI